MEKKQAYEEHLGGYTIGGNIATFYPRLWSWIVKNLEVKSVLDVGCGEGQTIDYFKKIGCEVLGIDGSKSAIKNNLLPNDVVLCDYTQKSYVPQKEYDLVWSCEFVEHVEEKYKENFLKTFQSAKKYIFITHAIPGQKGWHHVNCQKKEYWVKEIEKMGFRNDLLLTKIARGISCDHFHKKGLVFINNKFGIFPIYKKIFLNAISFKK